jgi:hypothetical protein
MIMSSFHFSSSEVPTIYIPLISFFSGKSSQKKEFDSPLLGREVNTICKVFNLLRDQRLPCISVFGVDVNYLLIISLIFIAQMIFSPFPNFLLFGSPSNLPL